MKGITKSITILIVTILIISSVYVFYYFDIRNNDNLVYLSLEDMWFLNQVCVWASFPTGVDVHTERSDYLYFTTEQGEF